MRPHNWKPLGKSNYTYTNEDHERQQSISNVTWCDKRTLALITQTSVADQMQSLKCNETGNYSDPEIIYVAISLLGICSL